VVADTFPIAIEPGTAPGTYRLMTGLYRRGDQRRLPAYSSGGEELGDYPELVEVVVGE
jgi:hypothetical protein